MENNFLLIVWQLQFLFSGYMGELLALTSNRISTLHSSNSGTLKDGLSILELYSIETGTTWATENIVKLNETDDKYSVCTSAKSATFKRRILQAIEHTLKFYGSHLDMLPKKSDPSVGLSVLKDVDDKHGRMFQALYPISDWIARICSQAAPQERGFCAASSKKWTHGKRQAWKSVDVVKAMPNVEMLGREKEHIWGKLNGQCQLALVTRCEVPYVCERTLYDPVPGSMYFLTHQAFQRTLTEQSDCTAAKHLLDNQVNDHLCSKMYQEARLISELDYPYVLRDLFSEYVAICGYMRYPNFFREDWIENLLSWQSRSEYGCFINDINKDIFDTSDTPIIRRKTYKEAVEGLVPNEECFPHFTTVGLSALAMSWDYMEENCNIYMNRVI